MHKRLLLYFLILPFFLLLYACEDTLTGEFDENQPPRTFLTVDTLDVEERLPSRVEIQWWGDDPDGYVTGYEICIEDPNVDIDCDPSDTESDEWEYTERSDTTLILPFPEGEPIADIRFSVRAIDNQGLRDPQGASVVFPIENQPPDIRFDPTQTPPDTTYFMGSFGFIADDPDGEEDLNFYEIAINDTTDADNWKRIDNTQVDFFSIALEHADDGTATGELFTGRAYNPTDIEIDGVQLEEVNTIYLRASDQALEYSEVDEQDWYIKEQTSDILFINDDAGVATSDQHQELLNNAGHHSYDIYDISEALIPSGRVLPVPIETTLKMELSNWDKIYWVSGSLTRNLLFMLQAGSDFFADGGSIFVNAPIEWGSASPVDAQHKDQLFSLLPTSGFESHPDGNSFRLPEDFTEGGRDVIPVFEGHDEFDTDLTLQLDDGTRNLVPMTVNVDQEALYEADYADSDEYEYSRVISSIGQVDDYEDSRILYFGIDLLRFTEDSPVQETMNYFLNERLGF